MIAGTVRPKDSLQCHIGMRHGKLFPCGIIACLAPPVQQWQIHQTVYNGNTFSRRIPCPEIISCRLETACQNCRRMKPFLPGILILQQPEMCYRRVQPHKSQIMIQMLIVLQCLVQSLLKFNGIIRILFLICGVIHLP